MCYPFNTIFVSYLTLIVGPFIEIAAGQQNIWAVLVLKIASQLV